MKYRIAEFEINTIQFQLSISGEAISTEPKVFDLIVYLIENRNRVISRDELFDKIWAGREVSDTSLSNHVKTARKLFGDNGDRQQVIKTIRGRGYQFVANVEEDYGQDNTEVEDSNIRQSEIKVNSQHDKMESPNNDSKQVKLANKKWLFSTAALLLFSVVLLNQPSFNDSTTPASVQQQDSRPYIVVVPFEVSGSESKKWEAFADQITREVILKLRKISGLRVIPASSAFTFKHNKTHSYIEEQLPGIQFVLDATVSIEGESKIKISPQLDDLANENLVWNEHYFGNIDDTNFFSLQTDIANSVSHSLKVAILSEEKRTLGENITNNIAAYELYIEGQQQLALFTHDSLRRSISLFAEAIQIDPNFHAAMVAKADAYRIIMTYYEKPIDILPSVVDSVLEALTVKPDSAEAHSSLGLAYVFAWRWQDAWKMLNIARKEDPNIALTELGFALYYSGLGDVEGVKRSLKRANQLDPLNVELADWGHWSLAMLGETEDAKQWAVEKIRLHPGVGMLYSGASVSASMSGDHDQAIKLAKKGIQLDSGSPYSLLALAQSYGHAGQIDKIPPLLKEAESDDSYLCPYETAIAYLLIDDKDTTFSLLNDAVSFRSNCLIFTRYDPRLSPLRADPRFGSLLTRVGLDDHSIALYPR
ncbi:MAG: winged helix-turn-helix domain-containing protein [Kangiellaceae bacterium]|nr:winged helix-turn-helix domain-containing protein [Kangiellaceae bacterium]